MKSAIAWFGVVLALNFSQLALSQTTRPSAISVQHLTCEYGVDPLGVDVATPRLSWQIASDARAQRQTAYEILVASSLKHLDDSEGDLWGSGRVVSSVTTFSRYAGKKLESAEQVFWKVRSWDRDGVASDWSAPATWTMGLLDAKDWSAKWIVAPGATESLLLRHDAFVGANVRRATVFVSGLGQYELHINGKKIGDDLLTPGWTDYDKTALYDTYDVTAALREGTNGVGLMLGNGMYNVVKRNRFTKFTGSFGPLRAILQLRIEYTDGKVATLGTDETWTTHAGPITFNSIYGGEDFDARLEPAGWDQGGFDDSQWLHAVEQVRPAGTLRGYTFAADPIHAIETRDPTNVKSFGEREAVYDFGQNASMMPRLRVSGPAGSVVRLTPSEIVNADGTIQRSTTGGASRGSAWWQYTKATDGEETYFPKFFYVGCRYLKAELLAAKSDASLPRIESLQSVIVHSNASPAGEFATSNELLNRIRGLVRWAQRSNMVSVLTDCPHREKLGWLEQLHLNGPAIRYEFSLGRTFNKAMHDMADAQEVDGLVPTVAPDYPKFEGAFHNATEWGASFILVAWQQYQFEGDSDLLATHYPAMKKYFAFLQARASKEDDSISDGLGDWFDLVPGKKPGKAQLTPPEFTATAYYFYDAATLARIARVLGREEDAKQFDAIALRIHDHFNQKFFHENEADYGTNSQTANAMPVVMAIADPAVCGKVVQHIVDDLAQRSDALTSGDIGFRYLLQALAQSGRSDVIYKMINQTDKPGYGYVLNKGETAMTESWDANATTSHNHFMLGQITEWFYKDLAGIDVDEAGPGFEKIVIRPQPVGDLKWVAASYRSIHGTISVRWERDGEQFKLLVTIPANTSATVLLPAKDMSSIRESDRAIDDHSDARFIRQSQDRAEIKIASGTYTFKSRF